MDHLGNLTFARYVDLIGSQTSTLDELVASAPADASVPGCPDWDAAELGRHCAEVLAFWIRQVEIADADATEPVFGEAELARRNEPVADLGTEMVALLTAAGGDRGCWNWSGQDPTTFWVARRMANEFAVHLGDAQATAGRPLEMANDIAVDGIDELIDVFLGAENPKDPAGVLRLDAVDGPTWTIIVGEGVVRTGDDPTATLAGAASDLITFLWNRPAAVSQTGDEAVMVHWRTMASIQ